jgi:hypothetical protein
VSTEPHVVPDFDLFLRASRSSEALYGARWHLVDGFNAGEELLQNAGLKGVYLVAIAEGYAAADRRLA